LRLFTIYLCMPTHINNNKNAEIDLEIKNKFLLQNTSQLCARLRQVHLNRK